jgi:hypothetical protein
MTRTVVPLAAEAGKAAVVRPVLLARLDFASGIVRAASAPFDIMAEGEVYAGLGHLGTISAVPESAELQASPVQLTLSGIPPELVSLALLDDYQGRDVRIFLVLLDEGHVLVGTPVLVFRGRMDTMDIELGETATITLTAESRLADWERPRIRRYTDEDQKTVFPDDRGFEFVAQMAEKTIYWGR